MIEKGIISESRHQFENCKAAFRLLQGALVSGHYKIKIDHSENIVKKFLALDKESKPNEYIVETFFGQIHSGVLTIKNELIKPEITNKKIIVVDDQYTKCGWSDVFELMFGSDSVIGFENTSSALSYLQKGSKERESIFVIFVDLNFTTTDTPNGEGINLITELTKKYPSIPIIAFTAYDSTVWVKKAFDKGAWDYFSKDPNDKEAKEYKNALEYYSQFVDIISDYLKYHSKFSSFYSKVNTVISFVELQNFNTEFKEKFIDSIWRAYRYCVLDYVIRFTPDFFAETKEDAIVFQASKSLESLLVCVLDSRNLLPEYFNIDKYNNANYSLGDLVAKLEDSKSIIGTDSDWYKKLSNLVHERNILVHPYKISVNRNKFIKNPENLSLAKAQEYFENCLNYMIYILTSIDNF